jgi:hypothetical protein
MNRKGQEEIIGFVFIVLIVIIALVILLFIYINSNKNQTKDNREIAQLLGSIMDYTSSCAIGFEPAYSNLGELLIECKYGKKCTNQKKACEVFNNTMAEILDSSINVKNGSYVKGYKFLAAERKNVSSVVDEKVIIEINKGVCNGSIMGSDYDSGEKIISSLNLCF